MRWIPFVILLAACADSRDRDDEASGRTAARTAPAPPAASQPEAHEPMVRRVVVAGFTLVPGRPGAFEVRAAEGWPGRALDPVLSIGDLTFHDYDFPARDTIRFTVPDTAALPDGAAVFLQFGDDVASRVVITQALAVPR